MQFIYPITIRLSKRKITFALFGSSTFVSLGIMFVLNPLFFGDAIVISVIGAISILFFGLCGISILYKLFDKRPGLIIDEGGITDNSSATLARQIIWSDISDILVLEFQKQKLILVLVVNPSHYIELQKSPLKKKILALNCKLYGTPLIISSAGLKITDEQLINLIADSWGNFRQATS